MYHPVDRLSSTRSRFVVAIALILTMNVHASSQGTPSKSSKPQIKVGVLPFGDATASGGAELGLDLSRTVQAEIVHSTNLQGRVLPLEDGVRPEDLDPEKAVEIGQKGKVDVVLVGTVLEATAEESSKGGWSPTIFGQSVSGQLRSVKARVTLQGDLFNIATGKKIDSLRITGTHSDKKFGGAVYTSLGLLGTDANSFLNSPMGKALQKAVADLVKKIAATPLQATATERPAEAAERGFQ
jgi:hypothetical protein